MLVHVQISLVPKRSFYILFQSRSKQRKPLKAITFSFPSFILFYFLLPLWLLRKPDHLSCRIFHIRDLADCILKVLFNVPHSSGTQFKIYNIWNRQNDHLRLVLQEPNFAVWRQSLFFVYLSRAIFLFAFNHSIFILATEDS